MKLKRQKFQLNGIEIPSVNKITDCLSKDGLIKNFYRRHGFFNADAIANAAKEVGTSAATALERFRKFGEIPDSPFERKIVEEWANWRSSRLLVLKRDEYWHPEIHLINTKDKYHGIADVVYYDTCLAFVGDDKVKKRHANYNLLLNEHAYAMCDSMEMDGEIVKVPWSVPIKSIWLWTYHPVTGKLYPKHHTFSRKVYKDFLVCKQMYEINAKAEEYFELCAVLLPEEKNDKETASKGNPADDISHEEAGAAVREEDGAIPGTQSTSSKS